MIFEIPLKEIIQRIINNEPYEENKYQLLTAIGSATANDALFYACEEVRNELASDANGEEANNVSEPGVLCNGRKRRRGQRNNKRSSTKESKE